VPLQLTIALQVVPMAVAVVAYTHVARDGADGAWREHRRLVLQTMIYAALAVAGAYLFAPILVPLLAGRGFAPSIPLFRILTLSVFGMSLGAVMVPQWVGRGFFLRATALSLGTGLLSIIANLLVVPRYGMYACAWVTVISYSVHMFGNMAFLWWIESRAR